MTVKSGFFNSLGGDRTYDAADFGSIFDGLITDGIYQAYGTAFAVSYLSGTNFTIGSGRGWFLGAWVYNDSGLPITLEASEPVLHRYDAIVIEVNHTTGVRAASIKAIKGTASASPVVPPLTNTATVKQWPLAYIYRPGGSSTVAPGNIDVRIGTPDCPYSASVMASSQSFYHLAHVSMGRYAHKNFWRGANIGSSFTAQQKSDIASGSFDDVWLGDYWVIGGVVWRIVDIDYWYPSTSHHVVVMPDSNLYTAKMHTSNSNVNGYYNSQMRTTNLGTARTTIQNAFGVNNIQKHSTKLSTACIGGMPTAASTYSVDLVTPSETQVFGGFYASRWSRMSPDYDDAHPYSDVRQFEAFRQNQWVGDDNFWLRDTATQYTYALAYGKQPDVDDAASTHGVRPVFAIG